MSRKQSKNWKADLAREFEALDLGSSDDEFVTSIKLAKVPYESKIRIIPHRAKWEGYC